MTSSELLRRLRRSGAQIVTGRGKGGHVMVVLNGRRSFVPTGTGEIKHGTLLGLLKALELRLDELK
jgi:predicted RNA binding protein YcfA (HicA-like mRNA interferase family)